MVGPGSLHRAFISDGFRTIPSTITGRAAPSRGRFAMRQTPFVPPRRCRRRAWTLVVLGALPFAGWGCAQPPYCFYYGLGAPPCATVIPAPAAAQSGTICDPPPRVIEGSTSSSDVGTNSSTVVNSRNAPRVVVSEPSEGRHWFWQKSRSQDTIATTSVEGAVSESSANP
jgi:hypothetical protein